MARRVGPLGRWPLGSGSARTPSRGIWADHNLKPWKVDTFKEPPSDLSTQDLEHTNLDHSCYEW